MIVKWLRVRTRNRRRGRERGRGLVDTPAAERAGAAAVADVLDLDDDVVGFVEFQLGYRRCRVGAHPDGALDAVALEQRDDTLRLEAVHAEAEVIDAVAAAKTALPFRERNELGARSDRQHRDDRLLPVRFGALHAGERHPQHPLVKLERALQVGNGEVQVVETAHRDWRRARLRNRAAGDDQPRD